MFSQHTRNPEEPSKIGNTVYYKGRPLQRPKRYGLKSNYFYTETRKKYWISGPRKNGADRFYGEALPIEIDEEMREEYWAKIRDLPERPSDQVA